MENTASYDAASPLTASDARSDIGPCSDDPVIAELFAHAARRNAILRQYLPGVVFDRAGDGAQGAVADLSVRRGGDAAAGLGVAGQLAAPALLPDHHRDRGAGRG